MGSKVANDRRILSTAILLSAGIFLFDLATPLGVAGGVPYIAVVLLSLWSSQRKHTFLLAAGTSVLTILGLFLSPKGGLLWVVCLNRFLALFAIWVTALLSLSRKRVEEKLREYHLELEDKIAERTGELLRYRDHLEDLVAERSSELQTAQSALLRKQQFAVLGRLIGVVSHDIRNPLSTLHNALFSIRDAIERNQPDRVERALQLAGRSIRHCDDIINDLLDFTRQRELKLEPTDLDRWLADLLDEQAFPDSIECLRELHSGATVKIDREHLRRAVVNTFTNAIQALQEEDANGNRLRIETCVAANRSEIRFTDTGPGIPEELRNQIFEPLFTTKSSGVGLGLSIIVDIMKEHEGGLEWLSKEGQGTTVTLWLPMLREGV